MTNKVYDILKYIAQIVLPALATLVITIFTIWNLPYGEAIAGTIMAVDAFMGAVLMLESKKYHNGLEENENGHIN